MRSFENKITANDAMYVSYNNVVRLWNYYTISPRK